jgi:holo-[acyl-carrier protein] synthase
MIHGIGVDLVNIQRLQQALERWGDRFLKRVFTPEETSYCQQFSYPSRHLAGIFAAKEAVLKALGTGLSHGMSWQEIKIKSVKGRPPQVELTGTVAKLIKKLKISSVLVTLSHDTGYAVASAVALRDPD